MTPRLNRIVRNDIEDRLGIDTIDEIERYNDLRVDSLEDYGVELSTEEEHAQQVVLEDITNT